MKLGKLIFVEIAAVIIVLAVIMVAIQGIPSFGASGQSATVSMFQEKEYSRGSADLAIGETARTRFNYTTYDPAILIIELNFHEWKNPGNITIRCNGRPLANIFASPEQPEIELSVISLSGADWVQPSSGVWPAIGSFFAYGNEITFASASQNGFSGIFDYKVSIRGSR